MNGTAIVMMVVAMVMVWGGLLLALVNIKRSPEEVDELDAPEDSSGEPPARDGAERGGSVSAADRAGSAPAGDRV